jgi:hypothetical protein
VIRLERALHRKTVQELWRDVGPLLGEEVAAKLDGLIEHRNRLAHRFLREQAALEPGCDYRPGTHRELVSIMGRFMRSYQAIMKRLMTLPGYDRPVPKHWTAVAQRIVDRAFAGQPNPRDTRLQ